MRNLGLILLLAASLVACKNSKKAEKASKNASTEVVQAQEENKEVAMSETAEETPVVDEKKYQPKISDSLFFSMDRTPCFGQCPIYSVKIYQNGNAVLEGRRFFDFIGTYKVQFSESEMNEIKTWANEAGYWQMNHVYDAPVTDLPSTTTALVSGKKVQWVYNRMKGPDALRTFEQKVETLIKGKEWTEPPKTEKD